MQSVQCRDATCEVLDNVKELGPRADRLPSMSDVPRLLLGRKEVPSGLERDVTPTASRDSSRGPC